MIKVIADLHLAKGVPEKTMEVFGSSWFQYMDRLEMEWKASVSETDTVLIPGDISWASTLAEFEKDLAFLATLPGTKIFIRGNHDYWSSASYSKILRVLPPKFFFIRNNCFVLPDNSAAITGTRLWSSETIKINPAIFMHVETFDSQEGKEKKSFDDEKIFLRELGRLEAGLQSLPDDVSCRIVMTHYPPIGTDGAANPVTEILEKYGVSICFFGHLHGVNPSAIPCSRRGNVDYKLTAADFLGFHPLSYEIKL